MLTSVPWRLIIWAFAGLAALYFVAGDIFGPHRKARRLLINGVGGLAASWGIQFVLAFFGVEMNINLAVLAASAWLGIPGAALMAAFAWVLR